MLNLFGESVPRPLRKGEVGVGCDYCPLNKIPGLRKVKGLERIQQRRAMLWAQSPGARENEKNLELVGPVGQFLWEEAGNYGLRRDDIDVQNVLRCRPLGPDGYEHLPTRAELRCCNIYNEQALDRNGGRAVVHLVLGEVAGKQLLGKLYRKDRSFFWHEEWGAYVVLAPHPSYVLRLGGKQAGRVYYNFRDRLKAVKFCLQYPGRWGYVRAQDYGSVNTVSEMDHLLDILYSEAQANRRISLDIEDGFVDDRNVLLLVGAGWGRYTRKGAWNSWRGGARSVILEHPKATNRRCHALLKERLARLISDPTVKKVLQHGSYDSNKFKQFLGVPLRGYDYDSQYAAYLRNSTLRSYSLNSMVHDNFQEFMDYHALVLQWSGNYAHAPLDRLVTYNCGDCDLTKRVEVRNADYINYALLQVYIQVAFVLDFMEHHGPLLDWPSLERLAEAVPKMIVPLEQQLRHIAGRANFNPGSPPQVAWLLYDHLQLPQLSGRSTLANVLSVLWQKTKHPAPKLVTEWRGLSVIKNTFLEGYARSARENDGELRTVWWLTGAASGRLRSGGGKEIERAGIINLQNTHGNDLLQNLIVSDKDWRLALGDGEQALPHHLPQTRQRALHRAVGESAVARGRLL